MEYKKLSECCISIADGDHLPPPKADSGIPFITISNVDGNNHIDFTNAMYVPESYYDSLDDKRRAHKGDILYSVVGSFGIPILITDEEKFVFQRHIAILRSNKKVILPEYLYYIMKSKAFYGMADAYAVGAAQRTISLTSLRNMKIAVPPIDIQEKMVSHLLDFDRLIDDNNKRIKLLEQMAENLYKEWFVRFRFPGHEKAEFENGIPKGWEIKTISDYYATSSGGTPSTSNESYYLGSIPWVKTGELLDSYIFDTESHISEDAVAHSSAKYIEAGSLLLAMYAGNNVGKMGFVEIQCTCNQACCVFNSNSFLSLYYLFEYLKTQREYLQSISFGAAQQNISQQILKKVKIIVPNSEIVQKYDSYYKNISSGIKSFIIMNNNLIKQRDLLLPRLMSGKLEV